MNILFLSAELSPLAKVGGLADATSGLAKALGALGHDVRVMMPLYRQIDHRAHRLRPSALRVQVAIGRRTLTGRVWQTRLPGSPVRVYAIAHERLFDRAAIYGPSGGEFSDSLLRYSFFSQAALALVPQLRWRPAIVHCHDWHAALACVHLACGVVRTASWARTTRTVLTIHNLAHQGMFPARQWSLTGLDRAARVAMRLDTRETVNCLKLGLRSADRLTTVSPTYATEIQSKTFGCGLHRIIRARRRHFVGILNGIDPDIWNPETDQYLAAPFSAHQLAGKARCKLALQHRLGLPISGTLLVGLVQRLMTQKGIDIVLKALNRLAALPVQLVVLGTGDPVFHRALRRKARRWGDRMAVTLRFDEALAHQIEGGADAFLMPSKFEPCGLNQLYSMRYGTVPIVRRVGGLADTVIDLTARDRAVRRATGFVFGPYTAQALVAAVQRAVHTFARREAWRRLIRNGMCQDFSWRRSARAYVQVYRSAISHRTTR